VTRDKSKSAADFLTALNADPAYVKKRGAQEDARVLRGAEISLITRPLLQELAEAGYPVTSLDDLLTRYAPLPPAIVTLLLDSLSEVTDTAVQEQMVRALGASAGAFDGTSLITVFQNTHSAGLQYAIANTMAQADVRDAAHWILDAVQNPANGTARQMLALAAARRNPPMLANPVLLELLDDLPGHVALALAESGQLSELEALETKYTTTAGWEKQQIGRAISAIRRRLDETT